MPTVYRSCTPIVDEEYGHERNESPSEVIIEALATAAGVDPLDLPSLYQFVDPDAIDALFQRHEGSEAMLSFKVDTWNVFVRADGRIRICDASQSTDPEPVFEPRPA